jgi:hypothetical protein
MFAFAVGHSSGLNEKVQYPSLLIGLARQVTLVAALTCFKHFASQNRAKSHNLSIHHSQNTLYLSCITKSSKGGEVGMSA